MKKSTKIILTVLGVAALGYGSFLLFKTFRGFSSKDEEKEFLLGNYFIMMGIPDTKANRKKYDYLTLEQLKKELGTDEVIDE